MAKRRKKSGRKSQPHGRGRSVADDLASMPVEALIKMRDEVIQTLNRKGGNFNGSLPR